MNDITDLPMVSVIIPTHNREDNGDTLEKCLTSIFSQNYPRNRFEVIVVSDSSDDLTELAQRYPVQILTISQSLKPGGKRNLAASVANGEIIAFCDDDATVHRSWLRKLVSRFANPEIAVVGGPNHTSPDANLEERCSGYVLSSFLGSATMVYRYRSSNPSGRDADETDLISCNMAVRKSVLDELGGFPGGLWPNEENVFCHHVKKAGYRLVYAPDAIVWHRRHPVFLPHAQQVFRYGAGRGEMIRMVPSSLKMVHLIPSTFVVLLLIGSLLSLLDSIIRTLFFAMLFVYLMSILMVSARISTQKRDLRAFIMLPTAFILHHCAYGIGVLKGLFSLMSS